MFIKTFIKITLDSGVKKFINSNSIMAISEITDYAKTYNGINASVHMNDTLKYECRETFEELCSMLEEKEK